MAVNVRFIYGHFTDAVTVTASTEDADFPAENAVDLNRRTQWKATDEAAETLTVDLGAATLVTGLFVGNHNMKALIDDSGVCQLRGSTDDFSASDVLVKALVPTNDDDYYATFSNTFRYWRLSLDNTGGTLLPEIGVFYLGTAITLDNNPDVGMDDFPGSTDIVSRSLSGAKVVKQLGRFTYETRAIFRDRVTAERTDALTLYERQTRHKPPAYIPRDDSASPTEGNARYVRFQDPRLPNREVFTDTWDFQLNFSEEQ